MGYINLKSKNNENIKNDKSQKIPIKIGHNSNYYSQNNISEISKELILTPFYLVEQWVDYFYFLVFSDLSNLRVNYLHSCRREGPPQSVTITTRIILTPTSQITGLKINFFRKKNNKSSQEFENYSWIHSIFLYNFWFYSQVKAHIYTKQ